MQIWKPFAFCGQIMIGVIIQIHIYAFKSLGGKGSPSVRMTKKCQVSGAEDRVQCPGCLESIPCLMGVPNFFPHQGLS